MLLSPPASPSPTPNILYEAGMWLLKAAHPGFIDVKFWPHGEYCSVLISRFKWQDSRRTVKGFWGGCFWKGRLASHSLTACRLSSEAWQHLQPATRWQRRELLRAWLLDVGVWAASWIRRRRLHYNPEHSGGLRVDGAACDAGGEKGREARGLACMSLTHRGWWSGLSHCPSQLGLTITEHHRWGGLPHMNLSPTVLEAQKSKIRVPPWSGSDLQMAIFSPCLTWQGLERASPTVSHKGTNPISEAPPSWPNHLPKAPSPNTITLDTGASIYEFWRNTNIQSDSHLERIFPREQCAQDAPCTVGSPMGGRNSEVVQQEQPRSKWLPREQSNTAVPTVTWKDPPCVPHKASFWRRGNSKRQPTPGLLPGELHEQRSLASYSWWGRKESDTTEQPSLTHSAQKWWLLGVKGEHTSDQRGKKASDSSPLLSFPCTDLESAEEMAEGGGEVMFSFHCKSPKQGQACGKE